MKQVPSMVLPSEEMSAQHPEMVKMLLITPCKSKAHRRAGLAWTTSAESLLCLIRRPRENFTVTCGLGSS